MQNKSIRLQAVNTIMYLTDTKRKIAEKWIDEHYLDPEKFNLEYDKLKPTGTELGGCIIGNRNISEYLHKFA